MERGVSHLTKISQSNANAYLWKLPRWIKINSNCFDHLKSLLVLAQPLLLSQWKALQFLFCYPWRLLIHVLTRWVGQPTRYKSDFNRVSWDSRYANKRNKPLSACSPRETTGVEKATPWVWYRAREVSYGNVAAVWVRLMQYKNSQNSLLSVPTLSMKLDLNWSFRYKLKKENNILRHGSTQTLKSYCYQLLMTLLVGQFCTHTNCHSLIFIKKRWPLSRDLESVSVSH